MSFSIVYYTGIYSLCQPPYIFNNFMSVSYTILYTMLGDFFGAGSIIQTHARAAANKRYLAKPISAFKWLQCVMNHTICKEYPKSVRRPCLINATKQPIPAIRCALPIVEKSTNDDKNKIELIFNRHAKSLKSLITKSVDNPYTFRGILSHRNFLEKSQPRTRR